MPCTAQPMGPGGPVWAEGVELRAEALEPLAFLDVLRARRDVPRGVRVWWPRGAWVRAADVPALLALGRSSEPVAVTCSVISAHAVPVGVRSTLGREALRLVAAYRRGRFPEGCSDVEAPPDPAEMERWWAAHP